MDGIPALDLWNLVIEVFHCSPNQANNARDLAELHGNQLQNTTLNMRRQIPTKHINLDLTNVDHFSSNMKLSGPVLWYLSLRTMKPRLDTKHQLADILTKFHT